MVAPGRRPASPRASGWRTASAGVRPDEIDYICAHGTGTPTNDATEVARRPRGLRRPRLPPISSIKSMIGHTMGAASGFGAIACCKALEDGLPAADRRPSSKVDPALGPGRRLRARRDGPLGRRHRAEPRVRLRRQQRDRHPREGLVRPRLVPAAAPSVPPLAVTGGRSGVAGRARPRPLWPSAARPAPGDEPGPSDCGPDAELPPVSLRRVPDIRLADHLGRKGTRHLDRLTSFGLLACRAGPVDGGRRSSRSAARAWCSPPTPGSVTQARPRWADTLVQEKPYLVNPAQFPNTVMNAPARADRHPERAARHERDGGRRPRFGTARDPVRPHAPSGSGTPTGSSSAASRRSARRSRGRGTAPECSARTRRWERARPVRRRGRGGRRREGPHPLLELLGCEVRSSAGRSTSLRYDADRGPGRLHLDSPGPQRSSTGRRGRGLRGGRAHAGLRAPRIAPCGACWRGRRNVGRGCRARRVLQRGRGDATRRSAGAGPRAGGGAASAC